MLDAFNKITAGFFIAMIALSSVGLMVGGVGVVAIMMISVTERTREIGVRKALGATRGEIMFQFLVEAATLTLVGCLIGMALGALRGLGYPLTESDPGIGAAALRGSGGRRLDPDRRPVRSVPREQGVEAGSGGGAEIRVDRRGQRGSGGSGAGRSGSPDPPVCRAAPRCPRCPRHRYTAAMALSEALRLAVQAIWSSKLRSFFTLLGILVSVAFLIVVVAIIQGMNSYVSGTLTASMIGTNTFQVRRGPISVGPDGRRAGPRHRQAPDGHDRGRGDRGLGGAGRGRRGASVGLAHAGR